jgi:hypothetical protein
LSYSKVRAVSRVATAETEATLVEWALHATAAQLDRLVAAQRRVARAAEVRARHDARYLSWRWDDDCSLIGSFPLPPEQAAILLQALEVAKGGLPAGAAAVVDTPEEAPATPVDAHHWLVNDGGWTVAVIRPGAWRFCASDGRHLDTHHASARASLPLPVDPSIAPDAVTGFGPANRSISVTPQAFSTRMSSRTKIMAGYGGSSHHFRPWRQRAGWRRCRPSRTSAAG